MHDPGRLPAPGARASCAASRPPSALTAAAALAADRGLDRAGRGPGRPPAAAELIAYQNPALAGRYLDLVARRGPGRGGPAGRRGRAGELAGGVADGVLPPARLQGRVRGGPAAPAARVPRGAGRRPCRGGHGRPVSAASAGAAGPGDAQQDGPPGPGRPPGLRRAAGSCGTCAAPRPTCSATAGSAVPSGGSPPSTRPACAPCCPAWLTAGPARRGRAGPAAAGHPRLRADQAGRGGALRRGPGEAARRARRAR